MTSERATEVRIGPQGRTLIPFNMRKTLGVTPGEVLVARIEDDRLVLERRDTILARARDRFAAAVPRDVSLVDELIAERRLEAEHEAGG